MSTTTQNRLSKQSQPKQKTGEPVKPRVLQPTTEQLRMAELLQKSNLPLTEQEIAEKVATLCDAAQCTEDDALIALGDADYDPNRALNLLIERPEGPDSEWQQATAKKNKKTTVPQTNGERDAYVPEREARGVADGAAKRGRGGRGRTHATQNGEVENGRGRGRRQLRQNEHAQAQVAPPARDEETQQTQPVRALNGHVHEQADTQQSDEQGWQSARSRNDSHSKRGRTDGELDDGARRGEARSVNRLAGRAPPAAQRGAASTRGRSAGPHQGDSQRTYYTRSRAHEQNGDAEVNDSAQPDDAAGPRPDARAARGRATNAGSRAPRNKQSNAPAANHASANAHNDEWVNDEWEGGPGSWQNTDTSAQPKAEAAETNVISFASIVAQRNVNANASHSAPPANSSASAAPAATVNANANAKPPQSASAQSAQPPVSAATPTVAPTGTQVNSVAPQQQTQPEHNATSQSQRPAPVASSQQAHTQKIELADLLSKATSPQSQPHPQPQPAAAAAAASAAASTLATVAQPATTNVAPRPANSPFGGVSGLGAQTTQHVSLTQTAFSQAALSNLAVGSQTQTSVGRSLAAPNQPSRLLQDEAVVMPFKVSEGLSSAFQFGFNADYVNPNANTTPLDAALNRAPQQPQSVGFAQPAATVAQQQHAASFADSLSKQQQQQQQQQQHLNAITQPQVAPTSRTFGNVAQPPFPGVAQPSAASTVQTSTSTVSAVATNLNRMALDSDVAPGSAMKATANAFVPAHLGSVPQQQAQVHAEPSGIHSSSQQQQRNEVSQLGSSAQHHAPIILPYAQHQQSNSFNSANTQHQTTSSTNNQQTTANASQSQASNAEPAVSTSASQPHPPIGANTSVSSNVQSKPTHIDSSRQLGGVALGVSAPEDTASYAQPARNQLPNAGPPTSQAALQQMFNQLAANLFTQNVSPAQAAQAAGQTGPSAAGPLSAAGTGGFGAPPGAPGQAQQYPPYSVYPPYHTPFAQAQQIFSLLQHGAPQNAAVQQPFAAASQPQSAAASGTPTQSNAGPPFGTATQFGIGLHSTMVGGASATQSGAGTAQNSAQQNAATAKLLAAAAASGGSFASPSYAGGEDSANAFGTSSMFVNNDYQRQPGVVPGYQQKGGTTDYPPFKPQTHVGVVGAPMLDKSGAGPYYSASGANQLPPSSNPPPGLGSVAGGQSTVSALNPANFGMYPNAAHHQYMMHPGMYMTNNIAAAGAIGAPKAATPTKPPGFQTQGNWQQQPY